MAMQAGLLKVVPQAVLDLLTWQELEKKICGDPEVTVDALKKLSKCRALLKILSLKMFYPCWDRERCGRQLLAFITVRMWATFCPLLDADRGRASPVPMLGFSGEVEHLSVSELLGI